MTRSLLCCAAVLALLAAQARAAQPFGRSPHDSPFRWRVDPETEELFELVGYGADWLVWRAASYYEGWAEAPLGNFRYLRQRLGEEDTSLVYAVERLGAVPQVRAVLQDGTVLLAESGQCLIFSPETGFNKVYLRLQDRDLKVLQGYSDGLIAVPDVGDARVPVYWLPLDEGVPSISAASRMNGDGTVSGAAPPVFRRSGSTVGWISDGSVKLFDLDSGRLSAVTPDVEIAQQAALDALDGQTALVGRTAIDLADGTSVHLEQAGTPVALKDFVLYAVIPGKEAGSEEQGEYLVALTLATRKKEVLAELPRLPDDAPPCIIAEPDGLHLWRPEGWQVISWVQAPPWPPKEPETDRG